MRFRWRENWIFTVGWSLRFFKKSLNRKWKWLGWKKRFRVKIKSIFRVGSLGWSKYIIGKRWRIKNQIWWKPNWKWKVESVGWFKKSFNWKWKWLGWKKRFRVKIKSIFRIGSLGLSKYQILKRWGIKNQIWWKPYWKWKVVSLRWY